jgi:ubiquinone/menaquinone biosynthesis C-methylase UbiE
MVPNHSDLIQKCYRSILEREPDEEGFQFYLQQLKDAKILPEKLSEVFKNSEEYKNLKYKKFLKKCYREILNREPDEEGFVHYLNQLKNDIIDESKLVKIFKMGSEYKRIETKKNMVKQYGNYKNFPNPILPGQDDMWYVDLFNHCSNLNSDFIEFLKTKNDVNTILEIGCGTGVYPIHFKNLFKNKTYTGFDVSVSGILHCIQHSDFAFMCGNFLEVDFNNKFDLVFSHAVIDHVKDINLFLTKAAKISKKYVYISAFNGFYPELSKNKVIPDKKHSSYINKISPVETKEILIKNGLKEEEIIIRKIVENTPEVREGTIIEISRID